jgi:hypothetical protein
MPQEFVLCGSVRGNAVAVSTCQPAIQAHSFRTHVGIGIGNVKNVLIERDWKMEHPMLHRRNHAPHECPVWMAPALQAFSGDVCGLFSQNSRVSGLFMFRHCLHWP